MTRTIIGGAWVVALAVTLALLVGCEPVDPTVESPPKPGQAEAVAIALAAYGLPADTHVPIAWLDGWECLNEHPYAPKVDNDDCILGMRSEDNGQIWIAWPASKHDVRDVAGTLAHEIAHAREAGDLHGCSSVDDPEWQEHRRCGDFWGVGGVVDAVTMAIGAMP